MRAPNMRRRVVERLLPGEDPVGHELEAGRTGDRDHRRPAEPDLEESPPTPRRPVGRRVSCHGQSISWEARPPVMNGSDRLRLGEGATGPTVTMHP